MRTGSLEWWFRNRQTGAITIAQLPNRPLVAIAVGWVIRFIAADGSTVHDVAGWAIAALWLYWAGDEIVRGVNPARRVLGAVVVAITVVGLFL